MVIHAGLVRQVPALGCHYANEDKRSVALLSTRKIAGSTPVVHARLVYCAGSNPVRHCLRGCKFLVKNTAPKASPGGVTETPESKRSRNAPGYALFPRMEPMYPTKKTLVVKIFHDVTKMSDEQLNLLKEAIRVQSAMQGFREDQVDFETQYSNEECRTLTLLPTVQPDDIGEALIQGLASRINARAVEIAAQEKHNAYQDHWNFLSSLDPDDGAEVVHDEE